ncbi:hypothetical protein HMPREF9134_00679 [Porphyromonas catoniae F0037]|uniref:Uncharacterized protein n=1 Tax=Porphyromonas catoniae F0037 TaxID=1127696 RepID=L1NGA4_9PORP|nr:hypothetical protein HMPREF9134_00679 [Porphyromonas catoniae F0037]
MYLEHFLFYWDDICTTKMQKTRLRPAPFTNFLTSLPYPLSLIPTKA